MSASYHYKKGMMPLGPYRLERMRDLVQQAEIGRAHQVSTDGGSTWKSAEEFSELFHYEEPEPTPAPAPSLPPVSPPIQDEDDFSDIVERPRQRKRKPAPASKALVKQQNNGSSNPFAISGFICSLVAAVLLAIPCLVWVLIAQSFFWIFNIVIPLGILAVLGLSLSVTGLWKTKSGLATAGTVLGVIALAMTLMAVVGSATIRYRMATLRRVQIDSWAADIELKRKDLAEALAAFRNLQPETDESEEQFQLREMFHLKAVAANLRDLAVNHDGHLTATASTSEFRQAFEEGLPLLRKSVLEVQRAAEEKNVALQEVLPAVNADSDQLKLLMDTLSLYEKGRLTLQQVEGKMTGK
jgi:ABC-type multidrug transport system fused ATPase/permease subunit